MENKRTKIEYLRDIFLTLMGVLVVGIICLTIQNSLKITSEDRIRIKTNEEIKNLQIIEKHTREELYHYRNLYYNLKEDYCTNPNNNNYKEICKN